jgi:P2X purinoceptor 4
MGGKSEKCKEGCRWAWTSFVSAAFEYDTPKIVHIKNKKVGFMNRIVQLGIIGYIVGYGIIYQKGYQKTGSVVGTVTTKMKGAYLFRNLSDFVGCEDYFPEDFVVYDPADYVIPPQEPDSFFVMTNMWVTCGQKYGICPEENKIFPCTNDADCEEGHVPIGGNGPNTGQCNQTTGSCNIRAWCPVENENSNITRQHPRINASNFTVLIKNSIRYPSLLPEQRKRNILPVDSDYLKNCTFSPHSRQSLYCPILSLGYIVEHIQDHDNNFTILSTQGGVVGIEIAWNCDLDWKLEKCNPKYSFRRLDDPNVALSAGFNFRFARYHLDDGVQTRTLYKAYGILFKVITTGRGGMFDFTTLVLKIGSMIALLGIAVVISDVVVLYVLKKRSYYRDNKYQQVTDEASDQEYEVVNNPPEDSSKPLLGTRGVNYSSSGSDDIQVKSDKF